MKILYITLENISLHKGSVVHIKETIDGLKERGHNIGLIARASSPFDGADAFWNLDPFCSEPSKVQWINRWAEKHPMIVSLVMLSFYLFMKARLYDIIYARDYHAAAMAVTSRVLFKKRLVYEMNGLASEEQKLHRNSILGTILVSAIKKAEFLAGRCSDKVIAVTPQIASYLFSRHGCQPAKVAVVSNGVNLKLFHPVHDPARVATVRRNFGIRDNDVVVIFVGNLAPWQGIESLIQAAPELVRLVKDLKFLIVGGGALKNEIETEIKKRNISENFLVTGMVEYSKIPLYINASDICVLLKRRLSSGFSPLKLYEYMACGKPILASRVEGLEFIEKEGIGCLVEPDHPGEIQKVLYDMVQDREGRIEMGLRGCRLAHEKHSWESKIIEIENLLETLR